MSMWHDPVGWWEGLDRPLRHLPRAGAVAMLAALALAMVWSAVSVSTSGAPTLQPSQASAASEGGEGDLALYARISQRVIAGEDYYAAAMAEQRAGNYPTRPFFTVRLPTLAMLHKAIGLSRTSYLALALLVAAVLAFLWRLRTGVAPLERAMAGVMLLFGGAAALTPEAGLIHELFAGLLLTLALAIYSPSRWWPSLVLAGLALAIRELAAPFMLLWLVFALSRKRWPEAAGILATLAIFAIGMALHAHWVAGQQLPGDQLSQGWNALAGPLLPLAALSRLTVLLFLPLWLAAPLAILPLLGWMSFGGRLGLFASLWFAGFFFAMALFARPENFYWVQLTLPAYLAGFAFVPRAFGDLAHAVGARKEMQS